MTGEEAMTDSRRLETLVKVLKTEDDPLVIFSAVIMAEAERRVKEREPAQFTVRCHGCKGTVIYKRTNDTEIEVFHTCDANAIQLGKSWDTNRRCADVT